MSHVLDHPFGCKDRVVIEDGFEFERQLSTPFYTSEKGSIEIPNWEDYARGNLNKMKSLLEDLPSPIDKSKAIYVFHMPPANMDLGVCYNGKQVGSQEIYNFINNNNPYMSFHGHIHESPKVNGGIWYSELNQTTCIQPRQTEKDESDMVFVIADTLTNTYERFEEKVPQDNPNKIRTI